MYVLLQSFLLYLLRILGICLSTYSSSNQANMNLSRNDEKTAQDYQLEGGATLHLVLALRGGF